MRTVVVALLLWTAADIANSNLCALDQDVPPATQALGLTADRDSTPANPVAPEAPLHVDDCFCCSHCVEVQELGPRLLSVRLSSNADVPPLASPRIFGVRLYHPPLV
jgi:hypothetical protein